MIFLRYNALGVLMSSDTSDNISKGSFRANTIFITFDSIPATLQSAINDYYCTITFERADEGKISNIATTPDIVTYGGTGYIGYKYIFNTKYITSIAGTLKMTAKLFRRSDNALFCTVNQILTVTDNSQPVDTESTITEEQYTELLQIVNNLHLPFITLGELDEGTSEDELARLFKKIAETAVDEYSLMIQDNLSRIMVVKKFNYGEGDQSEHFYVWIWGPNKGGYQFLYTNDNVHGISRLSDSVDTVLTKLSANDINGININLDGLAISYDSHPYWGTFQDLYNFFISETKGIPTATASTNGLMSKTDKDHLDDLVETWDSEAKDQLDAAYAYSQLEENNVITKLTKDVTFAHDVTLGTYGGSDVVTCNATVFVGRHTYYTIGQLNVNGPLSVVNNAAMFTLRTNGSERYDIYGNLIPQGISFDPVTRVFNFTNARNDLIYTCTIPNEGEPGVSVTSIEKTSTSGNVDTYTITYSNNTTSTFEVTNGTDGTNGTNLSSGTTVPSNDTGNDGDFFLKTDSGHVYKKLSGTWTDTGVNIRGTQIYSGSAPSDAQDGDWLIQSNGNYRQKIDGSWSVQFNLKGPQGNDGPQGVSIQSIEHTSSEGNVDTYTITLTNGNTTTFDITNGTNGTNGTDGKSIRYGNDSPSDSLGNDGDLYIDLYTYDVYTKTSGHWTSSANIKGANGILSYKHTLTFVDTSHDITYTLVVFSNFSTSMTGSSWISNDENIVLGIAHDDTGENVGVHAVYDYADSCFVFLDKNGAELYITGSSADNDTVTTA